MSIPFLLTACRIWLPWKRTENVRMQPTEFQRTLWKMRGLVAGVLNEARSDDVLVTFQELLPETIAERKGDTWWEAWWYCTRTMTAGGLTSVEPMRGETFGAIVKREVSRSRTRPAHTVVNDRVATKITDDELSAHVKAEVISTHESEDVAPRVGTPNTPIEQWERVITTEDDIRARRSRVMRTVACVFCGRVTGTTRRVCHRRTCQRQAAKGTF
jgi:hypothetical protein